MRPSAAPHPQQRAPEQDRQTFRIRSPAGTRRTTLTKPQTPNCDMTTVSKTGVGAGGAGGDPTGFHFRACLGGNNNLLLPPPPPPPAPQVPMSQWAAEGARG